MQTVTFDTSNTEEAGVRGKGQRIGSPIHRSNPDLCETMFTRTAWFIEIVNVYLGVLEKKTKEREALRAPSLLCQKKLIILM